MKRTLLFFCSIILLSGYFVIAKEIEPKIKLVYGRWGDKPGEFVISLPRGAPDGDMEDPGAGPNDFYVDENNFIYVLDNVNKRVQVFNNKGKFIKVDKEKYEKVEEMGVTRWDANINDEVFVGPLLNKTTPSEKEKPEYWGCRVKKFKENGVYKIELTLPSGKNILFEQVSGLTILGRDNNKNIYVEVAIPRKDGRPGGWYWGEIIKIREDEGIILGKIRTGDDALDYYYSGCPICLSMRGDIYIMNSDNTGFWIDCYPTELFDKPEGRDFTYLYEREWPTEEEEKEGLKELALRLAKTTKGEMRDSAIMYLGRNKIKEAMLIFEDYLKQQTKDKEILCAQHVSIYALKEMGTDKSIELIARYGLKSKDKDIKIEAAEILINTPEEREAIEVIKQMIKEPKIEKEIAEKLVYFGNGLRYKNKKEAIDIWIELLKVPKAHVLAREYLEETTGKDFRRLPEGMIITKKMLEEYIKKWEVWWEQNKDTFQFPEQDKQ